MSQFRQSSLFVAVPMAAGFAVARDTHPPDAVIALHHHDCAQLICATGGVLSVDTENGRWVVPPDRAAWVPAFQAHGIRKAGAVHLRTFYLAPIPFNDWKDRCRVIHVSALLAACLDRVGELLACASLDDADRRVLEVIVDEIVRATPAATNLSLPSDPRARRIADAVLADLAQRHPISAWTLVAHASERTIDRLFVDETGMTLWRWQRQARLLRAVELLGDGTSVMETARCVGFDTPSAFVAMFRTETGCTPGAYLRRKP